MPGKIELDNEMKEQIGKFLGRAFILPVLNQNPVVSDKKVSFDENEQIFRVPVAEVGNKRFAENWASNILSKIKSDIIQGEDVSPMQITYKPTGTSKAGHKLVMNVNIPLNAAIKMLNSSEREISGIINETHSDVGRGYNYKS